MPMEPMPTEPMWEKLTWHEHGAAFPVEVKGKEQTLKFFGWWGWLSFFEEKEFVWCCKWVNHKPHKLRKMHGVRTIGKARNTIRINMDEWISMDELYVSRELTSYEEAWGWFSGYFD
jgi:hypothetical protein